VSGTFFKSVRDLWQLESGGCPRSWKAGPFKELGGTFFGEYAAIAGWVAAIGFEGASVSSSVKGVRAMEHTAQQPGQQMTNEEFQRGMAEVVSLLTWGAEKASRLLGGFGLS
jgi:hypothetical protein